MKLFLLLILLAPNIYANLLKISQFGNVLPASSTQWACVLDDKAGLMWEVKTTDKTLHNASNTYTWYDKISGVRNGEYSHNCTFYDFCNTWLFTELVNEFKLCGYQDWRLPTHKELKTLIQYTDIEPLIDIQFFQIHKLDIIGHKLLAKMMTLWCWICRFFMEAQVVVKKVLIVLFVWLDRINEICKKTG